MTKRHAQRNQHGNHNAGRGIRNLISAAGNTLLTLAATCGAICLVGVAVASMFHVSLILFKSGSMSPTIPVGSVAVVRELAAREVKPGDVVTVDRFGELPITHRVVAAVPAGKGSTRLTLRGDANAHNDPAPYFVTHVRLVVASVPGAAQVLVISSHPYLLGAQTVGASLLVWWAFWPRRQDHLVGDELTGR